MKTQRILELDGLRAFAVTAVVMYHIIDFTGVLPNINPRVSEIIAVLGLGGVHVFFVISGFIITLLLLKEFDATGRVSLSSFYQRRFFRIIPPLLAYLSVLFILYKIGYISIRPIVFLWSLLFLGNFNLFGSPDSASGWFVGHTWSLSVEEQYYLIFPFIMITLLGFRLKPINALLVASFIVCLLANKIAKMSSIYINPNLIKLSALFSFRYIIVGVLLALHKEAVKKIVKNSSIAVPLCLIVFILLSSIVFQLPPVPSTLMTGIECIAYGFLVLWFVENPSKCPALRWKWIQWLGACSYSIYLWQQLFTGKAAFYNGWSIRQGPMIIIAILTCASLSHYFIELPSIKLSRILTTRKSKEN